MSAKSDTFLGWFFAIFIGACICLIGYGGYVTYQDHAHRSRFEGACQVQGGKVEGDLCIKDNVVILRLDQVK